MKIEGIECRSIFEEARRDHLNDGEYVYLSVFCAGRGSVSDCGEMRSSAAEDNALFASS
jgi:hypothetical protein